MLGETGQVQAYGEVWETVVREPVVEKGLYFTHTGLYIET